MIVLFFGSENCKKCKQFLLQYSLLDFPKDIDFVYIDIHKEDNQELCDLLEVDKSPCTIITENIDGEDFKPLFRRDGYFHPSLLKKELWSLIVNKKK